MSPRHWAVILLAAAVGLTSVSPKGVNAADFDHASLAATVLERHIRPGYERLQEASDAMVRSMETLCAAPDAEKTEAAKQAFGVLVEAWGRIEHIRFGPVSQSYAHERLAFWPDPKGIGRRQVRRLLRKRDLSVLEEGALAKKSVALQGLTALEVVLFAKGSEAIVVGLETGRFRCRYGLAVARNIAMVSDALVKGWGQGADFAVLWLKPGPDNAVYLNAEEVTRELAQALIEGLLSLRDHKVAGPMGLGPKGSAPTRPAFARSGLALRFIKANADGFLDFFSEGGFADAFRPQATGLVDNIVGELTRVRDVAAEIAATGATDLRSDDVVDQLLVLGFPLKNARERAAELVADIAGLVIRFNDSDAN